MVKIKIISNPYEQTICFETVDNNHTCHAIKETGYRGDLISHNYKKCFKVKEILDLVMADFGSPTDHLELVFQGTSDEWRELELIVKQNHYTNVTLSRSHLYLENARDILKQIILVFQKLSPLLAQNLGDAPMIKRELEKFSEASGEEIPLYVVGNFSSGKSTFINALIGHEVLPSSAKPTTAKIYKIKDSLYNDRASISFSLDNQLVSIQLHDGDYKLQVPDSDDVLLTNIKEILQKNRDLSIQRLMSELLLAINKAANKSGGQIMSDLIQVELPFAEDGVLKRHASRFVILDTPGSDSANNREHFRVLKNTLEGLSNGLPIIVSEFESLDRTNADALANEITSLEELDQRFTMIIVNKADSTKLHDYSEEDVLNTAIPQKLYASGIYFLSSLMGLGSKINEQFTDPYSSEIFMDQKRKYLEKDST